uniref:Short-chain dehydrogenase n=1 Tax=Heliothis virescens TaxID=7102 RepID=A0A2A4JIM8_HELVI
MSFAKKVVLITGCSAGIGPTTTELFAKECAQIAIVGRNDKKLHGISIRCVQLGAPILVIKANLAKNDQAELVVKRTIKKYGKLDVLINNSGILKEPNFQSGNFLSTYDEVTNVNLSAIVRITYFAVPHLIKSKGNIINILSHAGIRTTGPKNIAYRTSKAGIEHFTKSLALELAPSGVRVNAISPGPVLTRIFDGMENYVGKTSTKTALTTICDPLEIANLILYVASEKAKEVTGSNFLVDNGSLMLDKLI